MRRWQRPSPLDGLLAHDSPLVEQAPPALAGCSKKGTVGGKNQLLIALGSAGECCAVLDCVSLSGSVEQQDKLRRMGAMLIKMIH